MKDKECVGFRCDCGEFVYISMKTLIKIVEYNTRNLECILKKENEQH